MTKFIIITFALKALKEWQTGILVLSVAFGAFTINPSLKKLIIMALIKCPECNREISDTAKTCPHCGYKLNAEQVRHRNKIISWTIVLLLLLVLGIGLFIYISSERAKEKQAQEAFYEYLHESSMPGSYQDARYAIVGTHPNWELIDNSASASIIINFKLDEDEKNGVPFKQSEVYRNWSSYFKSKN